MAQTVYASFVDASHAEKAAGALLDFGARQEDLSIVANDEYGHSRLTHGTVPSTAAGVAQGTTNVAAAGLDATKSVGNRLAQAGDRTVAAVAGAVGADGTAANYDAAADTHAVHAEVRSGMAANEPAVHGSAVDADRAAGVYTNGNSVTAAHSDTEVAAKHGISTTTAADAGEGAVKGTGIGLGLGILAGLASLMVPGVGLVLGGGALATAIGGTALAAGAGAVAGGVTGYLKDQGVPDEAVEHYQGTVAGGGAVLSLHLPSGNVDQTAAEQILTKYGGQVNTY